MTISELLANEELRQHEFPVTREKVFLAHAGVCALPRRVAEAIAASAAESARGDQEQFAYPGTLDKARSLAAQLLHCQAAEVALVGPTSLGLSLVASGLKFRRNDNILIYQDDYPSNVYPWLALAERGVEVRMMNVRGLGQIRPRDVLGQVDENTRLVALSSCHFLSGQRLDLQAVGSYLRERSIRFCVDGIQSLGAFPTTVESVDMLAADAHKWLLGPCGAGLLYVRQSLQQYVNPPIYGWHNVACPDFVAQDQIQWQPDARKFEAGTHNFLGVVGLAAALELILEVGVENIARELARKRALLLPALQAKGYTVLNAEAAEGAAGGLLSFSAPGRDMAALHRKLEEAQVITSLRGDRAGHKYIRISPHFYNTDAELQRFLDLV